MQIEGKRKVCASCNGECTGDEAHVLTLPHSVEDAGNVPIKLRNPSECERVRLEQGEPEAWEALDEVEEPGDEMATLDDIQDDWAP